MPCLAPSLCHPKFFYFFCLLAYVCRPATLHDLKAVLSLLSSPPFTGKEASYPTYSTYLHQSVGLFALLYHTSIHFTAILDFYSLNVPCTG
ncbi:hypothetical protein F4779DRAFT_610157 [Xylariaceae sp. FL0662B]|nr:hypothetical protein F4779DRAFT_610157 [Xylariaceae sp. FL0662B]